LDYRPK